LHEKIQKGGSKKKTTRKTFWLNSTLQNKVEEIIFRKKTKQDKDTLPPPTSHRREKNQAIHLGKGTIFLE